MALNKTVECVDVALKNFIVGQTYKPGEITQLGSLDGCQLYEHETQDLLGKSALHVSVKYGKIDLWFIYHAWEINTTKYKLVYKQ